MIQCMPIQLDRKQLISLHCKPSHLSLIYQIMRKRGPVEYFSPKYPRTRYTAVSIASRPAHTPTLKRPTLYACMMASPFGFSWDPKSRYSQSDSTEAHSPNMRSAAPRIRSVQSRRRCR